MHKQKATSMVLQINNTVHKNQNSCTLLKSRITLIPARQMHGTTTSLSEHFVAHDSQKRWWSHQRDACVTLSHSKLITRNYVVKLRLAFHTSFFPRFPSPAFSTPVTWCHVFQSRIFRSRIFIAPGSVPKCCWCNILPASVISLSMVQINRWLCEKF